MPIFTARPLPCSISIADEIVAHLAGLGFVA
jgi:hypothetical protein